MTIRGLPIAPVVILMAGLGIPEAFELLNAGHDPVSFPPEQFQQPLRRLFLFFIQIKDRGTVLRTDIRSLPVLLRRIVNFQKAAAKRLQVGLFPVEHHFDRFDMAGLAGADLADDTSELALVGQILDDARVTLGDTQVEMELFVAR